MNLEELRAKVDGNEIDTVLLALTDMQGRLQGKRLTARHFVEEVAEHGAEGCNYLLAVDVEMNTVEGYEMSSWERGYGDFSLRPDLATLRPVPWQEGTAMVLCDLAWEDGSDVVASRVRSCAASSSAWPSAAGAPTPAPSSSSSCSATPTSRRGTRATASSSRPTSTTSTTRCSARPAIEPLIRRIRNSMEHAGMAVENSKGECNFGQHEINFRYADALRTADEHAIYKNGAKEIAAQEGMAISFMAKFNEREGSSCHIHFSLSAEDRACCSRATGRCSSRSWPASWPACAS